MFVTVTPCVVLPQARQLSMQLAEEIGVQPLAGHRPPEAVPFNIIPVAMPQAAPKPEPVAMPATSGSQPAAAAASSSEAQPSVDPDPELKAQIEAQAEVVRQLKDSGLTNRSPEVQSEVSKLLKLKEAASQPAGAQAQAAEAVGGSDQESSSDNEQQSPSSTGAGASNQSSADEDGTSGSPAASASASPSPGDGINAVGAEPGPATGSEQSAQLESTAAGKKPDESRSAKGLRLTDFPDHPYLKKAVWQLSAQPLFFAADRNKAKELAKLLVPQLMALANKR